MPLKLVVSIINYRTAELTIQSAQSVLDDINRQDVKIVIIDNASCDGSAEKIEDWINNQAADAPIELLHSTTNSGFSGGHNQGIVSYDATYYLLLNSDAILRPGFIDTIISAADATPSAGLVAPQIETDDGDVQVSCFRFHSLTSEFVRGAGSGPISRLFKKSIVALDPPVNHAEIEWASFACILLRKEMIDQIGNMDESYFLYFEDVEYGLRAHRAGWGVVLEPHAVAVHFRGGSGPVKSLAAQAKRLPKYYYASRSRFFFHRYGRMGAILANLAWMTGRGLNKLRVLAGKPTQRAVEREARDIWINAGNPGSGPRYAQHEDTNEHT